MGSVHRSRRQRIRHLGTCLVNSPFQNPTSHVRGWVLEDFITEGALALLLFSPMQSWVPSHMSFSANIHLSSPKCRLHLQYTHWEGLPLCLYSVKGNVVSFF